ncbi:peroxin Pex22-like protein [Pseudomassariella vexata]|uniref:Peroxin Pex22-like protein n=1 Tax=Pseudomassariella vexata TaxID=1141098 RepID=A0A1Y2DLD2_9PEZI|nr:peroxin Pex22-like protein [Pseudomassariella vexata]ORY59954.1 peroxin Pex22-like protein [Pseudomassariella vexata]
MSSSYDSSRRRGVWSHWVPLVVTVTVATVGVAAWAWSQRTNEEEHDQPPPDLDYDHADYGDNPPYGAGDSTDKNNPNRSLNKASSTISRAESATYGVTEAHAEANANAGWGQQMSGALRRTPSPQQFLTNAGKTVAAGVGAVGAAMGSALAAIREEDKNAYADHETWSEEAESRKDKPAATAASSRDVSKHRKTVAVVVSADTNMDDFDEDAFHEHASILSHIPQNTDFSKIKLFVLIYSPGLKETVLETTANNLPPASLSSSFSMIGHDQGQTPGSEAKSPLLRSNADPSFNAVYSQALSLVEKESMVMPFTSANGHVHILRHLGPEVVYLQESLAGDSGSYITHLQTWLRHDVILVVGADGGHGGLADSESEAEKPEKTEVWWQKEDRVGRGRGVVVVDSLRVGDDWARRVQGLE